MTRRYRVAIVGTGIGARHVEGFAALPELFDVAVVCGRDPARTAALADAVPGRRPDIHLGFDAALLAREDIDIVDICLPPDRHFAAVRAALEAGRHVICEKPLVGSLAEADALAGIAARCGRVLMPVFQARFGNGLARARHLLRSGAAGRVHVATAETHWQRGPAYYATPWRGTLAHELGGAFVTHAIHIHDMLTHLLGPVRSVSGLVATRANPIETEDTGGAVLELASGAIATLSVSLGSAEPSSRLRIVCANVTMTSGGPPASVAAEPWRFVAAPDLGQAWLAAALAGAPSGAEGFVAQFSGFHAALSEGTAPPVTLDEARASLELASAIYHSSRTGRRVELPLGPDHPAYGGWAGDLRR